MKVCVKCQRECEEEAFPMKRGKRAGVCHDCRNAYNRAYYQTYERRKELSKSWNRAANQRRRHEVFRHYGLACAVCGEDDFDVLTIDHINNDGAAHRRAIARMSGTRGPGGSRIYCWLKKNSFPPGFQTLCQNCNVAKHKNKLEDSVLNAIHHKHLASGKRLTTLHLR